MSSRFSRLVVPMMGALTPSFAMHHAKEIWAMLTPFFFASSSILHDEVMCMYQIACVHEDEMEGYIPLGQRRKEADVVDGLVAASQR